MLVLARKVDQRVRVRIPVGDGFVDVWVVVVEINPGRVKIGFDAPGDVGVAREEIIGHENTGGHGGGKTQG